MMKQFFQYLTAFVTVFAISLALPLSTFADTYGSGAYSDCKYSEGCVASGSSNQFSSAVGSVGNAIAAFFVLRKHLH